MKLILFKNLQGQESTCFLKSIEGQKICYSFISNYYFTLKTCRLNQISTVLVLMTSLFSRGCIFSEALQMYYMLNYRSLKCSIKWYTDLTLIIVWIVANLVFIYVLANYAQSGPGECWTLSSSFFFLTMRLPYYTSLTGLIYRFEYNLYKKLDRFQVH